MSKVLQGD